MPGSTSQSSSDYNLGDGSDRASSDPSDGSNGSNNVEDDDDDEGQELNGDNNNNGAGPNHHRHRHRNHRHRHHDEPQGGEGGVPQYVDMVIPQYETSSSAGEDNNNSNNRHPNSEDPSTSDSNGGDSGRDSSGGTNHENDESAGDEGNDQQSEDDSDEHGRRGGRQHHQHHALVGERVIAPSEADVLLNGGVQHPGNRKYRAVVKHLAKKYTAVKQGYRKAAVEILVNAVKVHGGRFLKKDGDGQWRKVSQKSAYENSSRAIRKTCRKLDAESSGSISHHEDVPTGTTINRRQHHHHHHHHHRTSGGGSPAVAAAAAHHASMYNSESRSDSQDEETTNLETIALRLQTKDMNLDHLVLDLQKVDHDYLFTFAKALDSNDILRSIDMTLANLSRTNANALAWGIKQCPTLQQVKLSFAAVSEKRSSIVLSGVLENRSVVSLNLGDNDIDGPTCVAICKMIADSPSHLQRLSLENNPIGDEGAKAVAELISTNQTIHYLNLGCNMFSEAGISIVQQACKEKTAYLFEVSGLPSSKRKRDVTSSEDSQDTPTNPNKKQTMGSHKAPSVGVAKLTSDPNGFLVGTSVRQGPMSAMTTSDNGVHTNSTTGSDEGRNPTSMSSMTGSDNGYAPAGSSAGSDGGRTSSGYAPASSTTGSDEGRNSCVNDSDSNQFINEAASRKTSHFFEMEALASTVSKPPGKQKSDIMPASSSSTEGGDEPLPKKRRGTVNIMSTTYKASTLTFRNVQDFDKIAQEEDIANQAKRQTAGKRDGKP